MPNTRSQNARRGLIKGHIGSSFDENGVVDYSDNYFPTKDNGSDSTADDNSFLTNDSDGDSTANECVVGYAACGGVSFEAMYCCDGFVCTAYDDEWYMQCLPE